MFKRKDKFLYVNVLVALGLFLSSLAPFCVAKASSKNFIQICTTYGVKTIAVDQEGPENSTPQPQKKQGKTCAYCFASHMGKIVPDEPLLLNLEGLQQHVVVIAYNDDLTLPSLARRYEARAPPYAS